MNLTIHSTDTAVLVAYLLAVVLWGLWVGRGRQTLSGYLLADRQLPWWAILGSIVATETSTATFLSVPGLSFTREGGDLRFLQLAIGLILGRFLVIAVLMPHYFRGELYTAYEVLNRRFGGAAKRTGSLIFLVARNLGDGLRLFLTALVLSKVIGAPLWLCIVTIEIATILYTFAGGMKSVVWNDCIQFVVYIAGGVLAGVVIVSRLPGGFEQFVQFGLEHDKFRIFDVCLDFTEPYTLWAGVIGGVFLALGTHGTDQMMVQRYLCARSRRAASGALAASGFVVLAQFALFLLVGVALASFYDAFPPAPAFKNPDHVFATFIVEQLPAGVGLIGLILASVFAAAMSTLSSSLNSSAASALNDLCLSSPKSAASPERLVWWSRALTVLFGALQIAVAITGAWLAESVVNSVLAIAGFTTGLLLGVFALGVLTTWATQRAALMGLVGGLASLAAVIFFTPIAWPWYTIIGAGATFACGAAVCVAEQWGARNR